MTRVLVHAGFHKTGTTSLQDFLDLHRSALPPDLAIYLRKDMPGLARATRRYSRRPSLRNRLGYRRTLRQIFKTVADAPVIFISWEGLLGMMPGQPRKDGRMALGYGATGPTMARDIDRCLRRRFGSSAQIEYLLTVRQNEPWVKSLWHHRLRNARMTDDFVTFRAHFGDGPDLIQEAQAIRTALPRRTVHVAALEDLATHKWGPASAVFDILGMKPDLPPAGRSHTAVSDTLHEQFLALNRQMTDKKMLQKTKRRMLRAARS